MRLSMRVWSCSVAIRSLLAGSRAPGGRVASRADRGQARARPASRAAAARAGRALAPSGFLGPALGSAPDQAPPARPDRALAATAPGVWTELPSCGAFTPAIRRQNEPTTARSALHELLAKRTGGKPQESHNGADREGYASAHTIPKSPRRGGRVAEGTRLLSE